jgi:hypothetical protein
LVSRAPHPTHADLKRAVSTAYYAVFHALCWNAADTLIGRARASRGSPAWRQTYRAMEHGFAKGQCEKRAIISKFPAEIRAFAQAFVILQERRQSADYDPSSVFQASEVEELIIRAEDVIAGLGRAPPSAGARRRGGRPAA